MCHGCSLALMMGRGSSMKMQSNGTLAQSLFALGLLTTGLMACGGPDTGFKRVSAQALTASHDADRSHDASEDCSAPSSKQVMICHVPPGNPAARHTICVGINGARNGHGLNFADPSAIGGHGGDTLGACGALPEPTPSGVPSGTPSGTPSLDPSPTPDASPIPDNL